MTVEVNQHLQLYRYSRTSSNCERLCGYFSQPNACSLWCRHCFLHETPFSSRVTLQSVRLELSRHCLKNMMMKLRISVDCPTPRTSLLLSDPDLFCGNRVHSRNTPLFYLRYLFRYLPLEMVQCYIKPHTSFEEFSSEIHSGWFAW